MPGGLGGSGVDEHGHSRRDEVEKLLAAEDAVLEVEDDLLVPLERMETVAAQARLPVREELDVSVEVPAPGRRQVRDEGLPHGGREPVDENRFGGGDGVLEAVRDPRLPRRRPANEGPRAEGLTAVQLDPREARGALEAEHRGRDAAANREAMPKVEVLDPPPLPTERPTFVVHAS